MKKTLSVILVVTLAMTSLTGCGIIKSRSERAKLTEKLLKEKYSEDFVVDKVGGADIFSDRSEFTAFCYPKSDKRVYFKANVNGYNIVDWYDTARLQRKMGDILEQKLSWLQNDYTYKIDVLGSVGYDNSMSVKEYTTAYPNKMRGYIFILVDDSTGKPGRQKMLNALNDMFSAFGDIDDFGLDLLYTDKDTYSTVKNIMDESVEIDSTLVDYFKAGLGIVVKGGKITEEQFKI